jgi:hypothetical protein
VGWTDVVARNVVAYRSAIAQRATVAP